MLASSYIVLTLKGFIPLWVTLTVISRDFLIAGGFILLYFHSNRLKPSPSIISKLTTLFQIVTIIYILWSDKRDHKELLFYFTVFLTILSGIHYLIRGLKALKQSENI